MINKIVSFIKKFYSSKNEEESQILDGIYFHEDYFRQVEFLPRENYKFLKNENLKVKNFSEEHSDGNGLFTDIYLRQENEPKSILEKKIELNDLESTLNNLELEKVENVYTGYSSHKEKCSNMIAFKYDDAEIFIGLKENIIADLFVTGFRFFEDEKTKMKLENILYDIGTKYDLILNDWDLTEVIDLKDRNEIKKYLNEEL